MRKTFSITDKEVLEKLEDVESQSQYIQGLVIKDIYGGQAKGEYEAGILTAVEMLERSLRTIKDSVKASTK